MQSSARHEVRTQVMVDIAATTIEQESERSQLFLNRGQFH